MDSQKERSKITNGTDIEVKVAQAQELPVNAMARVVIQLGEQLIENEVVALLELIKNCYDADATHVVVEVNTTKTTSQGQGYIRILDNGNGMDQSQIKSGFLMISTLSKTEKDLSPRKLRVPLGEKGVGRLSAQRLAGFLNVRTKSWKSDEELLLSVDWKKFNDNVILGNIMASLDTYSFDEEKMPLEIIKKSIPKNDEDGNFGFTELTMYGLLNIDFWNQKSIEDKLRQEVLKLINPYKKSDNIIIKFIISNDDIKEKEINTELVDQELLEQASVYKLNFRYKYPRLLVDVVFNSAFYKNMEKKEPRENLPEFFEPNHIPIDEKIREIDIIHNNDRLQRIFKKTISDGLAIDADPGEISGNIYVYNYGNEMNYLYEGLVSGYSEVFKDGKEIREFIKENAGVKVYRDNFKVLPYGGKDNDWLGLTRLTQTIGSFLGPKLANTVGYIEISSKENKNLREMTNRQGFLLDPYGENFINICKEIAAILSSEAKRQSSEFSKKYPRSKLPNAHDEATVTLREVHREIDDILKGTSSAISQISSSVNPNQQSLFVVEESKEILVQAGKSLSNIFEKVEKVSNSIEKASSEVKAAKMLYEYTNEEMAPLFELSALGIVAEALTHELNKSNTNTKFRSTEVQSIISSSLKKIENQPEVSELLKRAFGEVRLIQAETNSIERQISHLSPGFRKKRRRKDIINLSKELKSIYCDGVMANRAKKIGISINIKEGYSDVKVEADLGALMQIFDNLYLNSEYWLQRFNEDHVISEMVFNIDISDDGIIKVWDSGKGIDPTIESSVFLPFQTRKEDGRGLGLYIVNFLMDNQGATIRLANDRNTFGRRYLFTLDFSKILMK